MTDFHEPDSSFLDNLEWQVQSAVRRQSRFAQPVRGNRLGVAALVLVSALVGAGAGVASERIQTESQDLYVTRAELELQLAEDSLRQATREHERATALYEAGMVTAGEVAEVASLRAEAEFESRERALELEEVYATGAAPRGDLVAPLVGQRDFVREHLRLRLDRAAGVVSEAAAREERTAAMLEAAVITYSDYEEALALVESAKSEEQLLAYRFELRSAFLRGELSAAATLAHEREQVLRTKLWSMQSLHDRMQIELERAIERVKKELVSRDPTFLQREFELQERVEKADTVRTARRQVERMQSEKRLVELELELLVRKLGEKRKDQR